MQKVFRVLFCAAMLMGCSSGDSSQGNGGSTQTSGSGGTSGSSGSGGTGGTGGTGGLGNAGASLPEVCPLFTQDLAAQSTTKLLKQGGRDQVITSFRYCYYDGSDGTQLTAWGALTANQGSAASYMDGCVNPSFGPAGQLISGIGVWACFLPSSTPGDAQGFSASDGGKYVIDISGNADLGALKQVAVAFLAKLPK